MIEHPLIKTQRFEIGEIALERHLVVRAAFQKIEDRARQPPFGGSFEMTGMHRHRWRPDHGAAAQRRRFDRRNRFRRDIGKMTVEALVHARALLRTGAVHKSTGEFDAPPTEAVTIASGAAKTKPARQLSPHHD